MIWVGGIRAFRYVVVDRIITPVELTIGALFVYGAVIIYRHQLYVGDAQLFEIVETGGMDAIPV